MVVTGGYNLIHALDTVDLVSLDPINHPVPEGLESLAELPLRTYGSASAADGGAYVEPSVRRKTPNH